MTEVRSTAPAPTPARAGEAAGSPWLVVTQGAAMLAVGMGVGRFVYTPILPLMEHQAGLTATMASNLATANYLGYLGGALTGIFLPSLARSRLAARVSLLVVIATLALMPVTEDANAWLALRLVTGVASALLFVIATSAMLARLHRGAQHLVGWGFGGVGLGIAPSGALVLVLQSFALQSPATWRAAWWSAAVLAAVLGIAAWKLRPDQAGTAALPQRHGDVPRTHRWFAALLACYTFEGIGYIIAGTFLVAAISQNSPGAHLQFPRSVALLTAGYSVGQILGPLAVKPLLPGGYRDALLVAAAIVVAGAVAAVALRVRFPHRVGAMIEPSRPVLDR